MIKKCHTFRKIERMFYLSDNNFTIINEDGQEFFYNPTNEERILGMLLFLLSFFTAIVGPLIIWLLKRSESSFIDHYGKEYFNMIISYFVYGIIASILMFVGIGFIIAPILALMGFIFTIVGAIKAYQGEFYRIP